jgi:hypothetical protein
LPPFWLNSFRFFSRDAREVYGRVKAGWPRVWGRVAIKRDASEEEDSREMCICRPRRGGEEETRKRKKRE